MNNKVIVLFIHVTLKYLDNTWLDVSLKYCDLRAVCSCDSLIRQWSRQTRSPNREKLMAVEKLSIPPHLEMENYCSHPVTKSKANKPQLTCDAM